MTIDLYDPSVFSEGYTISNWCFRVYFGKQIHLVSVTHGMTYQR